MMILSNELPDFKDDTGVITTRFLILETKNSFLNREDPMSGDTLKAETSGILNWALDGLDRLMREGRFTSPGNDELNEELSSNASAVKAFVGQCCELGDGFTVYIEETYGAYHDWCKGIRAQSWADLLPINQFSGKVKSAFPGHAQIRTPVGCSIDHSLRSSWLCCKWLGSN
jgi:putative DNA primase/helicase